MILEYHRPDTLQSALKLLSRSDPVTVPMGGGVTINRSKDQDVAVVDLQGLGLNKIEGDGEFLRVGACATLQSLLNSQIVPDGIKNVILFEATRNIRSMATLAGTLVSASSRSPLGALLLAMAASLNWQPDAAEMPLEDFYRRQNRQNSPRIITQVQIPVQIKTAYQQVSRTPMDWPIVSAAAAAWPSGRLRLAIGGYGPAPVLIDEAHSNGDYERAVREAMTGSSDEWATAEYRQEMALILAQRCVREVRGR